MVGWTPDTPARTIAIDSIGQGVGLGLVFVPLNTIAFATLSPAVRTDGAALWTLIRNLGSSVGISLVIAKLTGDITNSTASSPTSSIRSTTVFVCPTSSERLRWPVAGSAWSRGC